MVRTVTSAVRVLDVLAPVLRDDTRVDLVFAYDPGSAFGEGVLPYLRERGALIMSWEQFRASAPHLIVTATENAVLTDAGHTAPVLVLPHGVGFHKYVPDARGPGERLAGLVPRELLAGGRVRTAVSHLDQAHQLPPSAHPLLIGDPCHDSLLAAGSASRERYRRALGVPPGRRLVLISSTWRDESALGQDSSLPARLLASLPADAYAVALVTHPNVISAHGAGQLEHLLGSARAAGLIRIPPESGWQAGLLAADLLVGDHGSVTFYGAALGVPVLLGAFSDQEAVAGTPMAELGRLAPRLDPYAPLLPQIEAALGAPDSDRLRKLGSTALADPGHALRRLRKTAYDLMGLPEPAAPAPAPLAPEDPRPVPAPYLCTAFSVTTRLRTGRECQGGASPHVRIARIPAAVATAPAPADEHHLSCPDDERDRSLRESASVLVSRTPKSGTAAATWARGVFADFPGAVLAAAPVAPGTYRIHVRDGRTVEAAITGADPRTAPDPGIPAAVVHACLLGGVPLDGFVTVTVADREEDVSLRVLP
ncbi:CDP-glycerol glycerophosphotransferase family protein [Streptomyces sp. NPDC048442]|uniref:CDP-glycerol glycerophosphotransferase family protein n=1 Tax=Streptomyces sp. NPDC048442 TaxID=3154823 RepID=UPI00343C3B17